MGMEFDIEKGFDMEKEFDTGIELDIEKEPTANH